LTLGRVKRGGAEVAELGDLVQSHSQFDAGPCPVGEVLVYASDLERRGPSYTVLSRSPLG
jgi:2'-5' RNA ligase